MTRAPVPSGPPRRRAILSIDGGGIRGVLTLEILQRLEDELRKLPGCKGTVLADHFDLIAGTSVGAIFASMLALGNEVKVVSDLITKNKAKFFLPTRNPLKWALYNRYNKDSLEALIKQEIKEDTRLGDPALKTRLMLVMRNASTDSPWIVSSFPETPFNAITTDECNLRLPLWQLIRASAAAPYFFAPEKVTIGKQHHLFVDGGLTGFNNPAFKAFQLVSTRPYGVNWPTGEDELSIVSVGTGVLRRRGQQLTWGKKSVLGMLVDLPTIQIGAADREADVLCRTFGRCLIGDPIDQEIGDLKQTREHAPRLLFSYYRLNISLDEQLLKELRISEVDVRQIARIDAPANIPHLQKIGAHLADRIFRKGLPYKEMVRSR